MAKLNVTSKYDMFVNDIANRNVTNIKKLVNSMKKNGFIEAYPLHVVEKEGRLHIKDGGHRYEAAKLLGLPIYYVICKDVNISIPEINNTARKWSLRDYVDSYIRMGNKDYLTLYEFSKKYQLSLQVCARLLIGEQALSGNADKRVKSGSFTIKNYQYASLVAAIINSISSVSQIAFNTQFINAVSRCCIVKGFDGQRFINNSMRCTHLLIQRATLDDYMDACEEIYNNHMSQKNRVPLKFMANKESELRNVVKNGPRPN